MQVKIQKLTPTAKTPTYGSDGAAAFDIYADLPDTWLGIPAGEMRAISTGIAVEVPPGHVLRLYSRSGHGYNHSVSLANCVGVIDSDYRGEVMVGLRNDGHLSFPVHHGDRIAQGIIEPIERIEFVEVEDLSTTVRGAGRFGSTGK